MFVLGGGVAALTFLCKTSWKNSILFLKAFAEYKKNNLIETSVYTFVIPYQFYTFILSRLPCIETLKFQEKNVLKKRAKISVNILCNKCCFESSCVLIKNICQQKITYSLPKHCQQSGRQKEKTYYIVGQFHFAFILYPEDQ